MKMFDAAQQIADVIGALGDDGQIKRAILIALLATSKDGLLVDPAGLAFRTACPSGPAEAATDVTTEPVAAD